MSDERLFSCFFCNFRLIIPFFYIFLKMVYQCPTQDANHAAQAVLRDRQSEEGSSKIVGQGFG